MVARQNARQQNIGGPAIPCQRFCKFSVHRIVRRKQIGGIVQVSANVSHSEENYALQIYTPQHSRQGH